jgi:hypothetical protein
MALKKIPEGKEKSLGQLPEKVRNKMGFEKDGGMMKARYGKSVESSGSKANKIKLAKDDKRKEKLKELRAKKVGPAEEARIMGNMKYMGGEAKGYGAARTQGEGLQDENLIPGKSLDYYKDIM